MVREVQEVSKVQFEGHEDPATGATPTAAGILEDPDGVTRLVFFGRELAHAPEAKVSSLKGTYELDGEAYCLEWNRWTFPRLYWSHVTALLLLQGATFQQVLPGWLVLRGDLRPAPDPLPGADRVVLAEITEVPAGLTHRQLFELLLPEAGGACAPALF